MDDVTDTVFRRVVGGLHAPDLYFTEFVNVDGLQSPGRQHLLKKLRFTASETSLVVQLWGKNPENFRKTAEQIVDGTFSRELGLPEGANYVGIDLNMGCPAKSEVNNGTCSALINNRPLAVEIIQATQAGAQGKLPVSVKTRLGFSEIDMTWPELLLQQKLSMLTIHGRTRKEMSKVPAHWDRIGEVREMRDSLTLNTLIIGNGDVKDREHGMQLADQYKLDGIMIGRGIFADPLAFAPYIEQDGQLQSPWNQQTRQQRLELFKRHVELYAQTWQHGERPIHTLNKFCKIYVSDFDGAKEMREQLMQAGHTEDLLKILTESLTEPVL